MKARVANARKPASANRPTRSNTESVDNYLKAILSLSGPQQQRVTIKSLACELRVAPASVTNMLQKLALDSSPMVEYERHGGVRLSARGKLRALEIVRHHRLLETFLYQVLDYPLEEVHDEAERLEHFISERFEERIAAKLGHPKFDPHGHSIPALNGEMAAQISVPLTDVRREGVYLIESVSDRDAQNLHSMKSCGLSPGTRLRVRGFSSDDGYLVSLGRSSRALVLSAAIAADIMIVPCAVA